MVTVFLRLFHRYSITSGNTNTSFTIDSNGTLSTATWLDYETTPSFALTIQARDSSSPSASQKSVVMEISIDVTSVNEHAPAFSSAEYSTNIAEDIAVGTSILRLTAVDQDDGLQGTTMIEHVMFIMFYMIFNAINDYSLSFGEIFQKKKKIKAPC